MAMGVLLLGCLAPADVVAEVVFLPSPELDPVQGASLASDGTRLVTWYCSNDPIDYILERGRLREWNGASWILSSSPSTLNCHTPDVAVRGSAGVVVWRDDGGDLAGKADAGGSGTWTSYSAGTTQDEYPPRLAFAFGAPYAVTTSTSAGLGDYKVYAECLPVGGSGLCEGLPECRGCARSSDDIFISTTVGTSASLAGDDTALYLAFTSTAFPTDAGHGCVNVYKLSPGGSQWLGDCFYWGNGPVTPQVAIVSGQPVVAWVDSEGLQVGRWDGDSWGLIRQITSAQTFSTLRLESSGSNLLLGYQLVGGPTQVVIEKWDGSTWSAFPNPLQSLTGMRIAFADLAIHGGNPHVALIVDGVLKVARLSLTPGAATPVGPSGTITDPTPTYTWSAVSDAADYCLKVDDGSGAGKIETWYTAAEAGCGGGTGNCSVTPATALALGAGQWRVQTRNSAGVGPWSAGLSFTVATSPPAAPTALGQFQSDGTTSIAVSGSAWIPVVFKATVSDPDAGQSVRLQVEVKAVGTAFTGATSCQSGLVGSGVLAECTVSGLSPGIAYHWRARAVDSFGMAGNWVSFGGNSESTADFSGATSVLLTVTTAGSGSGGVSSSPAGIDCGSDCSQSYPVGSVVTLTANPAAGGAFQWRGDACHGSTSRICQVTMTGARLVTGVFRKVFTNDPLVPQSTPIKAAHFTELREAIDTFRTYYCLPAFPWGASAPAIRGPVLKGHLADLRNALTEAYTQPACKATGRTAPGFTDPTLTAAQTLIKATHLNELRTFVRNLE
ncbi:MAG TPA: hypothetical protein VLT62_26350 [Candidatus Methylomirabilis sp.]|nr:hypothetical protein [Candidatus Methylomirabilis sp.]